MFFFLSNYCFAQHIPQTTKQQLENIADANDAENLKNDELLQQLDYFRKHPVNLNTATAGELQSLTILSDLQIDNLLRYRNLFGKLLSVYELQAVPTLDLFTITRLLPFVAVGNAVSVNENFLSRFKGEDRDLLLRATRVMEKSSGYDTSVNNHYLGDRNRLMFRYRYQYKNLLYYGLVADKDAGEQFFKGAQSKGFDFYSVHFFARQLGIVKAIALGDYTVNMGQGLIQWQSLAFGKSAGVMSVKRQSPVLMPYRSAGEFYFNRGIGITLQKKNVQASFFASYKKISGNIVNDSVDRFTSLLSSGYYRNATEIADRYKIGLTSVGGNLAYETSSFKIGWNSVAHQFSIPLQKRDEPYNYYAISGRSLFNSSVDYSYTYKNIHLFGEAATDKNFHTAFVSGALISVDPKVDVSVLYRNIQKEYQSLFGNAFNENTFPTNEKGIYTGIVIRPVMNWQLSAYADFFQFPWLRYRVNAPGRGYDYLMQLNYQPNKQFEMYVRYKNKNKPVDGSGNGVIYYPEDEVKQNLRIHISDQMAPSFFIQSRVEVMWYNHQTQNAEQGFIGYVEGSYRSKKLSSNVRLQYFETDSYNSRIYSYESDVLYSFSIPAFYDKGFRYYFNLNYSITKKIECWLRWGQTIYADKNSIGSGLDEIKGNARTEIKLQLRYSF